MGAETAVTRRFTVYPQPPTSPLRITGGSTEAIVLADQLAGPAVDGQPYAQMMFLRLAVSGGTVEPTVAMIAGTGDPVTLSPTAASIHRSPGNVGLVGDVWLESDSSQVYRVTVGFEAETTEQWKLLVTNNDAGAEYRVTAVVAADPADGLRPWLDVSPAQLDIDVPVGQTTEKSVTVANFGTVPFRVTSVEPLPPEIVLHTELPFEVPVGTTSPLPLTFTAPASGPLTGSLRIGTTPSDDAATNVPGHNGELRYHVRATRPPPRFAAPGGGQLSPQTGPAGTRVVLSGSDFDVGEVTVSFGDVEADPPLAVTAQEIRATVPDGLLAHGQTSKDVAVTVTTDAGSVTSDERFRVTAPPLKADRLLYYGGTSGRGAIGSLDSDNGTADVFVFPPGSFAHDWTEIAALSGDRLLYYARGSGRGVIGSIDVDNNTGDVLVFPPGSFAHDWTEIVALSADRVLFYSAPAGRGVITRLDADNDFAELRVLPPGSFAGDWTEIAALSGDRLLYYARGSGRGVIGSIDADNNTGDVKVFPPGSFAHDWTEIVALSADRVLFYSAPAGRGVITRLDADNDFAELRVLPPGSFAGDWTDIVAT